MTDFADEPAQVEAPTSGWISRVRNACPWLAPRLPLALLIALTLISQLLFLRASTPILSPDSNAYLALADSIRNGDWSQFYFRTPGYPLFIVASQELLGSRDPFPVIVVHFALGTLIPLMLYALALSLVRSRWLAAVAGTVFLIDRYSVAFQALVLTEFLSQFLLIASLAAYASAIRRKRLWSAPVVGLLFFTLLIVRPTFQLLYICVGIGGLLLELCYAEVRGRWRRHVAWYVLFLGVTQLLVWGWSYEVYRLTGRFGVSLQLGASLTNQTGDIMELAPDSAGPFRDIYLEYKKAQGGDHINVIERVYVPLEKATGLPRWDLSLRYLAISKELIAAHPGWYAKRVYGCWSKLWTEYSSYLFEPSDFDTWSRSWNLYGVTWRVMDKLYWNPRWTRVMTPYLFLLAAAGICIARRREACVVVPVVMITGSVIYNMLLTAMVQATEFGRYRLPVQPLYLLVLVCAGMMVARGLLERRRRPQLTCSESQSA